MSDVKEGICAVSGVCTEALVENLRQTDDKGPPQEVSVRSMVMVDTILLYSRFEE